MNSATAPVHTINVEIAKRYGLEASAFLSNLCFWICHNRANNRNYYEGKYWTYNKQDAFTELLPYFNKKQIEYLIKKLKAQGLVITGNFNPTTYDRTCWYTVSDEIMTLYTGISVEKAEAPSEEKPEEIIPEETKKQEPNAIPENSDMHILNLGNAYPKFRISNSGNSEMHILKSGNGNPDFRISLTDLNTADKPSLNHTAADVQFLKKCFAKISADLVFDEDFYTAAAAFLVRHGLKKESFLGYAQWLYETVELKKPKNLRYYYYKVFLLDEYIRLFASHQQKQVEIKKSAAATMKQCPACGSCYADYQEQCPECRCEYGGDKSHVQKMKIILGWDIKKRECYEAELAKICLSNFGKLNDTKQLIYELDHSYGLIAESG